MNTFRYATLILGLLGSLGGLAIFPLVAIGIRIQLDSGGATPNPQDLILALVMVSLYLVATLLGSAGALMYFSKPRTAAPILFVAGVTSLIPASYIIWKFYYQLAPTPTNLTYYTSTALLFVAGLLAIVKRQTIVVTAEAQKAPS